MENNTIINKSQYKNKPFCLFFVYSQLQTYFCPALYWLRFSLLYQWIQDIIGSCEEQLFRKTHRWCSVLGYSNLQCSKEGTHQSSLWKALPAPWRWLMSPLSSDGPWGSKLTRSVSELTVFAWPSNRNSLTPGPYSQTVKDCEPYFL